MHNVRHLELLALHVSTVAGGLTGMPHRARRKTGRVTHSMARTTTVRISGELPVLMMSSKKSDHAPNISRDI